MRSQSRWWAGRLVVLVAAILPRISGLGAAAMAADDGPGDDAPRRVAAEAIDALLALPGSPGATALIEIAECRAKLGDTEGAHEMLRWAGDVAAEAKQSVARNGNTVSYGLSGAWQLWRVAHAQAGLGDKAGAAETLRRALRKRDEEEADGRKIETLAVIAQEFTALGLRDEAAAVARRAGQDAEGMNDDQQVLPELAGAYVAGGDFDAAIALLDRVAASDRHERIRQFVLGRSLGEIAEKIDGADRAAARALLDWVDAKVAELPLAEDKYHSLSSIARAWARIGDYDRAMRAARLIGTGPTRVDYDMRDGQSYAMFLVALEQRLAGDAEGGRANLREAHEAAKVIPESRGRSGRLSQVAAGMVAAGDLDGALRCADDAAEGHRGEILESIARAKLRSGDRDGAADLLARAIADAETKEDPRSARDVAKYLAMRGDIPAAMARADAIKDAVTRAFALAEIARAQAAAGDARAALEWARKRTADLPRTNPNPLKGVLLGLADRAAAASK